MEHSTSSPSPSPSSPSMVQGAYATLPPTAHPYINALHEVGIEFQERTIGAFRMFSLVIQLHQDKRRQHAEEQLPKINNKAITVGPISTRTTRLFFGPMHKRPSSLLKIQDNDDNDDNQIHQHHQSDFLRIAMNNKNNNNNKLLLFTATEKIRRTTVRLHTHTLGALQTWFTNHVGRHHRRQQRQQSPKSATGRPEPLLQEIIFDYNNDNDNDDDHTSNNNNNANRSSIQHLFPNHQTNSSPSVFQISHFTPTGMMIEHNNTTISNRRSSSIVGFNATAQRHDSFSLVYVLDDTNQQWKTTHLPSIQPKKQQQNRISTSTSKEDSRSSFQTTTATAARRMSQILMAAYPQN